MSNPAEAVIQGELNSFLAYDRRAASAPADMTFDATAGHHSPGELNQFDFIDQGFLLMASSSSGSASPSETEGREV